MCTLHMKQQLAWVVFLHPFREQFSMALWVIRGETEFFVVCSCKGCEHCRHTRGLLSIFPRLSLSITVRYLERSISTAFAQTFRRWWWQSCSITSPWIICDNSCLCFWALLQVLVVMVPSCPSLSILMPSSVGSKCKNSSPMHSQTRVSLCLS